MSMLIRPASEQDIPTLVDFQLKMAAETENVTLDKRVLLQGVVNLFKDPRKGEYFVAEEQGQIMGCLMTTYEWSDWRDGTILWIQSVYVPNELRGRGIYKQLYEHIKQLALSDPSITGIRLYVDKKNRLAQQVYQKLGMDGEHYQVYEWMKP